MHMLGTQSFYGQFFLSWNGIAKKNFAIWGHCNKKSIQMTFEQILEKIDEIILTSYAGSCAKLTFS